METSRIREIIQLVRECGVAELEVKDESGRLYIRMPEWDCDPAWYDDDDDLSDDDSCNADCIDDASFWKHAEEVVAAETASADAEPEDAALSDGACDEMESADESESPDTDGGKEEPPAEAELADEPGALEAVAAPSISSPDEDVPEGWVPVISPVVGTFFSSEIAGDEPYAQVGKAVSQGKPLGVVKAMNICNRIKAPEAGVVRKILVADGDTVQYGTVLAYLEPADDLVRATLGEV